MKAKADLSVDSIKSVEQLEDLLSTPGEGVIQSIGRMKGDFMVLGAGGKIGPTLTRMIKRGSDAAGAKRRVIAVSLPSDLAKLDFESHGIQTIGCDLLKQEDLEKLPDVPNIVYMAGMKFGATGAEALTWAMNSFLPGMVSQRFRKSKMVAFSTGNIYGLSPVTYGGSVETDQLNPLGDYAMSCLGRERIFEHFSRTLKIPMAILRLNYAVELRYGVLVDLAERVWAGQEIDVGMGDVNVIWQGDAIAMTIRAFDCAASPPFILNVAGPELLSVRRVCEQLAKLLGKQVKFTGQESPNAFLNNGQLGHRLFGYPQVSAQQMMIWIADWVKRGGEKLGKPTHFETRDGRF